MSIKVLLLVFALVESSNNPQAIGDNGLAWGKFQFHKARWVECGGTLAEYGKASETRQDEIFLNEAKKVEKLLKTAKYKRIDYVTALSTYHNNGHIKNEQTPYVKKIKKQIEKTK